MTYSIKKHKLMSTGIRKQIDSNKSRQINDYPTKISADDLKKKETKKINSTSIIKLIKKHNNEKISSNLALFSSYFRSLFNYLRVNCMQELKRKKKYNSNKKLLTHNISRRRKSQFNIRTTTLKHY